MKRVNSTKPIRRFVKKIKRRFARQSKMEAIPSCAPAAEAVQSHSPCDQSFSEQDKLPQPCPLHSHSLFKKQKAATLPCMSCSGMTTCLLYEACCNSPVYSTTSNSSILSNDSGLGEDEADNDVFYSENESEEEDIENMVDDDDWWIDGNQIALRKVLTSSSCETVYRWGYLNCVVLCFTKLAIRLNVFMCFSWAILFSNKLLLYAFLCCVYLVMWYLSLTTSLPLLGVRAHACHYYLCQIEPCFCYPN